MSGEWHKWHAFNFILSGLVEELLALGAKPSVKMKVMWVWTRYMTRHLVKEDKMQTGQVLMDEKEVKAYSDQDKEKEDSNNIYEDVHEMVYKETKLYQKTEKVTKGLLLAIIYIGLNLDRSQIQLSHLCRFVREDRISLMDCIKFVPREINRKAISCWNAFSHCSKTYSPLCVRTIAMTLFKKLDLGTPLIPDMRNIVENYTADLCLPNDFRNLVLSLMNFMPYDFRTNDIKCLTMKTMARIPDFENVAMSYVLLAFKMCFGLDDDYEIKLSAAVDKINEEENHSKSYKLGLSSNSTTRLFSFNDWCNHLQLRRIMLCKHYLPMANQLDQDVDDYVFMEQNDEKQPKRKKDPRDEVTMDLLNRLPYKNEVGVICKAKFLPSLTPLTMYTEVILNNAYFQNPELKLLLCEDFTQYSLKYACVDLKLPPEANFKVAGVSEANKIVSSKVEGTLVSKKKDFTMVFVRNCENKHWLKTKLPTKDHIETVIDENSNERDSDHGYNSNIETTSVDNDKQTNVTEVFVDVSKFNTEDDDDLSNNGHEKTSILKERDTKTDITKSDPDTITSEDSVVNPLIKDGEKIYRNLDVVEEDPWVSIFDDAFDDLYEEIEELKNVKKEVPENDDSNLDFFCNEEFNENSSDIASPTTECILNPEAFDKEGAIKELILSACTKYKIPVPAEYNPREPKKRKSNIVYIETGPSESKKAKKRDNNENIKCCRRRNVINGILTSYYGNLERDTYHRVSEHVRSMVHLLDRTENNTGTANEVQQTDGYLDEYVNQMDDNAMNTTNLNSNLDTSFIDTNVMNATDLNSNIDSEEDDPNRFFPKYDQKFDEQTYDTRQLYLKFRGELNLDDIYDFDDPDMEKLFKRKIYEAQKGMLEEAENEAKERVDAKKTNNSEHSEDLNDLKYKVLQEIKKKQMEEVLDPLVTTDIEKFKYWFRHYFNCQSAMKSTEMGQRFDLELKENCPSSFNFVINECAAILDCKTFSLYKSMQSLEKKLMETVKKLTAVVIPKNPKKRGKRGRKQVKGK